MRISSAACLIRSGLWQVWSRLIALWKQGLQLQPKALLQWFAQTWASYRRYREAVHPGAVQFRGLRVDPPSVCLRSYPAYYRGCPIETGVDSGEPMRMAGKAFVPAYCKFLNRLRLKLHLVDVDRYPLARPQQQLYRGQTFQTF